MKRAVLWAWIGFQLAVFQLAEGQSVIWVSNVQDQIAVDYTSLQTAIDNATPGDTIMVYPSQVSYGSVTMNKPLHLMGVGYNIDTASQPILQIETLAYPATLGNITVNAGSGGGAITSLRSAVISLNDVMDFEVRRTYFNALQCVNSVQVSVVSNFVGNGNLNVSGATHSNVIFKNTSDILAGNNIFSGYSGENTYHNLYIDPDCDNAYIRNNIFLDDVYGYHSVFRNNIFMVFNSDYAYPGGTDYIMEYNVLTHPTGFPSNVNGADPNLIFVGFPTQGQYSFDSRYQLAPGSPAAGAGLNGEDCGVFGGPDAYKLSGVYDRPLIYQLLGPAEVPNGQDMDVTIKVRSEN